MVFRDSQRCVPSTTVQGSDVCVHLTVCVYEHVYTCACVYVCVHVCVRECAQASSLWFPGWLCVGVRGPMPSARLSGDRTARLRVALPYGNKLHAPAYALGEKVWVCSWTSNPFVPQPPMGHFRPRSQSRSEAPGPSQERGLQTLKGPCSSEAVAHYSLEQWQYNAFSFT